MKLIRKGLIIFSWVFLAALTSLNTVNAQLLNPDATIDMNDKAANLAQNSGLNTGINIGSVAAIIIKAFLSILGIVFIILILYAGFNWMTAAGDEEKVKKAKQTIQRAVIGLIIILAAYSITYFVFENLPFGANGYSV